MDPQMASKNRAELNDFARLNALKADRPTVAPGAKTDHVD